MNTKASIWFRLASTLIAASLVSRVVSAAEAKPDSRWRSLPLISNGHVDQNWLHVGWGGFVVDGDALRTECDPKGLGLLVYVGLQNHDPGDVVWFKEVSVRPLSNADVK